MFSCIGFHLISAGNALHKVEAAVLHEFRTQWACIAQEASVGLLPLVQMHCLHFSLCDTQKSQSLRDLRNPAEGHLYFWMDFKEHVSLPVGPEEVLFLCVSM